MINKKEMYEIAQGIVDNPSIELSASGETMKLEDDMARSFAIGYLAGIRDVQKNDIEYTSEVS